MEILKECGKAYTTSQAYIELKGNMETSLRREFLLLKIKGGYPYYVKEIS